MIQLPDTNLFIGGIDDLQQTNNQDWAFVHATQTIHYQIFSWIYSKVLSIFAEH
jgi:hypothetical protein